MSYATNTINYDDLVNNTLRNTFDATPRYDTNVPRYVGDDTAVRYGDLTNARGTFVPDNVASSFHHGTDLISRVATQILDAKAPLPVNETTLQTVRINGQEITGIWVNRDECLNWRGPIPLEHYKINTDSATVIKKHATHSYDQVQNISVRYLKPPPLQTPGDLIIKEEGTVQLPPAPPIIIRQQAAAVRASAPLVKYFSLNEFIKQRFIVSIKMLT